MVTLKQWICSRNNASAALELVLILLAASGVFLASARFDILEALVVFSSRHETWEIDELVVTSIFLMFAFALFALRRSRETAETKKEVQTYSRKLAESSKEIRRLQGILPICASCKKIRDDKGFWHQVDSYVRAHSEADFSHGLCPECTARLYPELLENQPADGSDGAS